MFDTVRVLRTPRAVNIGIVAGGVIGGVAGLAAVPVVCGVLAGLGLFVDYAANGHARSNLDTAVSTFGQCWSHFPLVCAIAGAVAGGAVGLVYAAGKRVFDSIR